MVLRNKIFNSPIFSRLSQLIFLAFMSAIIIEPLWLIAWISFSIFGLVLLFLPRNDRNLIFLNPAVLIALVIPILALIHSYQNSIAPWFEFQSLILIFALSGFISFYRFELITNWFKQFMMFFPSAFLVICGYMLMQKNGGIWHFDRLQVFNSPNSLSFYFCIFFSFSLFHKEKNALIKFNSLFSLLIVTLTDSRNGFFTLLVLGAIYPFTASNRQLWKRNLVMLLLLIITPTLINLISSSHCRRNSVLRYLNDSMEVEDADSVYRNLSNGRSTIWYVASQLIIIKPFFGWGRRSFSKNFNTYVEKNKAILLQKEFIIKDEAPLATNHVRDPHNLILGLFHDYGVIIGLLLLVTLAYLFFQNYLGRAVGGPFFNFFYLCFALNGVTNYHIFRPIPELLMMIMSLNFIALSELSHHFRKALPESTSP